MINFLIEKMEMINEININVDVDNQVNNRSKDNDDIRFFVDTDKFWKLLWNKIDYAQDSIFLITYCMDNDFIANHTLQKLIQ